MLSLPLFTGTLRFEGASVRYVAFSHSGKLSSSQLVLSVVWLATTSAIRSGITSSMTCGACSSSEDGQSGSGDGDALDHELRVL